MAEAGPSNSNGASTSAGPSLRPNRLPFPNPGLDAGIVRLTRSTEVASKGSLHVLSRPNSGKIPVSADIRRRVRSVDGIQQQYPSGLRRIYGPDDPQRRVASGSRRSGSVRGDVPLGTTTDEGTDYSTTAFSDEYDLCE